MRTSRRFIVTLVLLSGLPGWAQTGQPPPMKPKIIFVCEHGSSKSMIAAAEFSRMAKQNGLDVTVISRGTNPDAALPIGVRDGLTSDGHDVSMLKPTRLSKADLKNATRIVSFGPDLTPWLPKDAAIVDWSATPSVSENYGAARDYIRQQLEALLKDLKNNK